MPRNNAIFIVSLNPSVLAQVKHETLLLGRLWDFIDPLVLNDVRMKVRVHPWSSMNDQNELYHSYVKFLGYSLGRHHSRPLVNQWMVQVCSVMRTVKI